MSLTFASFTAGMSLQIRVKRHVFLLPGHGILWIDLADSRLSLPQRRCKRLSLAKLARWIGESVRVVNDYVAFQIVQP